MYAPEAGLTSSGGSKQIGARRDATAQYLGATSASHLLREPQNNLQISPDEALARGAQVHPQPYPKQPMLDNVSHHKLSIALDILDCLPEFNASKAFIDRNESPVDAWLRPAVYHLSESLFQYLKSDATNPWRRHRLKTFSQTLFDNAERPLPEGHHGSQDWLESISGRNFRWEGMGILFLHWALASHDSTAVENIRPGSMTGATAHVYLECADSCLNFVGKFRTGNTLLVYFLLKYVHLASRLYGETSLVSASLLAEAIAAAYELGLHSDSWVNNCTVSLPTEIRRRLFAHIYVLDKSGAIFTGRPPLVSSRYCSVPLPLDLSDEAVLALDSGVRLETDDRGWNTNGKVYRATLMRARSLMARVREDILEMALGLGDNVHLELLQQLRLKQDSIYENLPASLLYGAGDLSERTLDKSTLAARVLNYLEHLQNRFFIARLISRVGFSIEHNQELAEVSLELLSVILSLWIEGNQPLQFSFEWILVSYACPAAGILCNELLRPDTCLLNPASRPNLRRSIIVQQLSVLSGFLTSFGSGTTNAALWVVVKDVICRTLDQTLNKPATGDGFPEFRDDSGGDLRQEQFADVHVPENFGEVFAFGLLDTFDWLQDSNAQ